MYINEYNYQVNRISNGVRTEYCLYYKFEMPTVKYADWCGLVELPSAISFLQGLPMENGGESLNIYSLAGGTVIEKTYYYCNTIDGERKYHRVDCEDLDIGYDYRFDTKEQCAKSGYFPCEKCNP